MVSLFLYAGCSIISGSNQYILDEKLYEHYSPHFSYMLSRKIDEETRCVFRNIRFMDFNPIDMLTQDQHVNVLLLLITLSSKIRLEDSGEDEAKALFDKFSESTKNVVDEPIIDYSASFFVPDKSKVPNSHPAIFQRTDTPSFLRRFIDSPRSLVDTYKSAVRSALLVKLIEEYSYLEARQDVYEGSNDSEIAMMRKLIGSFDDFILLRGYFLPLITSVSGDLKCY